MALVIVMRCDVPGCEGHQTADFDAFEETFVALLNSFRASGWTLEMDGARVVRSECNLFGNHRRLLQAEGNSAPSPQPIDEDELQAIFEET